MYVCMYACKKRCIMEKRVHVHVRKGMYVCMYVCKKGRK